MRKFKTDGWLNKTWEFVLNNAEQLNNKTKRTGMEIIDKRSSEKLREFFELHRGDVFELNNKIFIRTQSGWAMELKTADMIQIKSEQLVTPVKATLTIERLQ